VKKRIGKNAVELDIGKNYPKLHPVFNIALIVRYNGGQMRYFTLQLGYWLT
jgi:hypothetical protein